MDGVHIPESHPVQLRYWLVDISNYNVRTIRETRPESMKNTEKKSTNQQKEWINWPWNFSYA